MYVFYLALYDTNKYFVCAGDGLYLVEDLKGKLRILSQKQLPSTFYIVKGQRDYYWLATFRGIYSLKFRMFCIIK